MNTPFARIISIVALIIFLGSSNKKEDTVNQFVSDKNGTIISIEVKKQ